MALDTKQEHDELTQFLMQYDLYEYLHSILLEHKLDLDILKKTKEHQIEMLCDDLNIKDIIQRIKFINAMEQLLTIDNNKAIHEKLEMKVEKDDLALKEFLISRDLPDVLYKSLLRNGLNFSYLSEIREDEVDHLFHEMQMENETIIKIKFRKALKTLNKRIVDCVSVSEHTRKMDVIFLGDSGVGKTSLMNAYLGNQFNHHPSTLSIDHGQKVQQLSDGNNMKIVLWDTAGQEKYNSIVTSYYKKADVIILCYDINNIETVINCVDVWGKHIADNAKDDVFIFLVGCKRDKIKNDEAGSEHMKKMKDILKIEKNWKKRYKTVWEAECSALTCDNVRNIFATSAEAVFQQREGTKHKCMNVNLEQYQSNNDKKASSQSSCCGMGFGGSGYAYLTTLM